MRSSQVIRASNSQCRSRNCPGFDPSILQHNGKGRAADEAVLNKVHKKIQKARFVKTFYLNLKNCAKYDLDPDPEPEPKLKLFQSRKRNTGN
jgi:hypothetical protein